MIALMFRSAQHPQGVPARLTPKTRFVRLCTANAAETIFIGRIEVDMSSPQN
jgi:hypothetical protein